MGLRELFLTNPEKKRRKAAEEAEKRGEDPQAARDAVDRDAKTDAANSAGGAAAAGSIIT